jgi:hypothetical protein
MEIEDLERELPESGWYTSTPVTTKELTADIEETKQKVDANLKRRVDRYNVIDSLLFFMSLLLMLWGGSWHIVAVCHHHEVQWVWSLGVHSLLENTVPVGALPLQLNQQSDKGRWGKVMQMLSV